MKILDLGSGPYKYPESISVDWNPEIKPDIVWDLNILPYPFKDNEFDMVYASHILEHLNEPVKVLEEIWRILKPNGLLILKVPHFSCRSAYWSAEHKHYFSSGLFDYFEREKDYGTSRTTARFKILKIKLLWSIPDPKTYRSSQKKFMFFIRLLNSILTPLANLDVNFCERVWCYWVGGFLEVQFYVRAVK